MSYGYTLMVYKKDRRFKSGERFIISYPYSSYSGHAMMDEIKDLKRNLYKPEDGWILDFVPFESNNPKV